MSDNLTVVIEGDIDAATYVHEPVSLQPGDILHLRVGIADLGDGMPPWIPTADELDEIKEEWEAAVPEDVTVIATHYGIEAVIVPTEVPINEVAIDE